MSVDFPSRSRYARIEMPRKKKPASVANKKDITLRDVINHMGYGFSQIDERFAKVDQRFDAMEKKFDKRFAAIETDVKNLRVEMKEGFRKTGRAFQHHYENRFKDLTYMEKKVDKVDRRVETIKREDLPAIKSHIGFAP